MKCTMKKVISIILVVCLILCLFSVSVFATNEPEDSEMNMFENSDFIEKEQPELTEETKQLISMYHRNPSEENYMNLRNAVIENYNAVLERKEAKLEELKEETAGKPGGDDKVAEMEEIVQEMYMTYWNRINSSMLRFTDSRLLNWSISNAFRYDYIPVMGAGESIYLKRTPVTNAEYAVFIKATDAQAPSNWVGGTYPDGEDDYPVNYISYKDAETYCAWLTEMDGVNTYRLPSEGEWELAAGHMPKDADFNCGVNNGRTPVEQYAEVTRGAHGAVDFWGNVWEWTSTERSGSDGIKILGVKGGSWSSGRTDCRTEYRKEGRDGELGYEDVGFRVIQVLNGTEPEQNVELATLEAPIVSARAISTDTITLTWLPVEGAIEYQLFEYCEESGLVRMLGLVDGLSITLNALEADTSYCYIVQPISCVEIADNVSAEFRVSVTTFSNTASSLFVPSSFEFITVKSQVTTGSKVVVRITSSIDVTAVQVNGVSAELISNSTKKGICTWKVVLIPAEVGNFTIKALAFSEDDIASEPITQTVAVNSRCKTTK